jgi:hypothetical protein
MQLRGASQSPLGSLLGTLHCAVWCAVRKPRGKVRSANNRKLSNSVGKGIIGPHNARGVRVSVREGGAMGFFEPLKTAIATATFWAT